MKIISALLGLVLCGAVSSVFAADQTTTTSAPAAPTGPASTPMLEWAQGSVSGVDLQKNTLKLKGSDGKTWNILLDPKGTTVSENGKLGTFAQLKTGAKVKVGYSSAGGVKLAKSIAIQ